MFRKIQDWPAVYAAIGEQSRRAAGNDRFTGSDWAERTGPADPTIPTPTPCTCIRERDISALASSPPPTQNFRTWNMFREPPGVTPQPAAAHGRGRRLPAPNPESGEHCRLTVQGLPLLKPPYGRITAINLDKGEIVWQIAHGETPDNVRNNPALKGLTIPRTGSAGIIGVLTTKTLVIAGEAVIVTTAIRGEGRDAARLRQGHRQGRRAQSTCPRRRAARR